MRFAKSSLIVRRIWDRRVCRGHSPLHGEARQWRLGHVGDELTFFGAVTAPGLRLRDAR